MHNVLIVGCGRMGISHAHAYQNIPEFNLVGLVSRNPETRTALSEQLGGVPTYSDFYDALNKTNPDVVAISTYTETHAEYAIAAMEHGAHVFVEKPLAETVADAKKVIETATRTNKKCVVGYILRHHSSWQQFINIAHQLGKPLVMRMNLNQQLSGDNWHKHIKLMNATSPIVDCGVHYVDVMCQMTNANPVRVHAIGARLTEEIAEDMYNFGQLQVTFDDGSVGWYEAGWGPMMSENAFFIKDVIGPKGCATIHDANAGAARSDDINTHTSTKHILHHQSELDESGEFKNEKIRINLDDEPDHVALCERQQRFLLDAIQNDIDLTEHLDNALKSLQIVLAADQSFREQRVVEI